MPRSLEEAQQLDSSRYEGCRCYWVACGLFRKSEILTVAPAVLRNLLDAKFYSPCGLELKVERWSWLIEEYVGIQKDIQSIYHPDYIDFEYYSHREVFEDMLEFSNLVLSYHNFQETPENMMEILSGIDKLFSKISQSICHGPQWTRCSWLDELYAWFQDTEPWARICDDFHRQVGKISRLTADLTGSSWSYARVGDESAPGQIPLENMRRIRELLEWRLTDILGWQRSLPIPFVISISPFHP